MKKSRSSVPLFDCRCPVGPAPPVRKDGLLATAGRPDPEPPLPAAGPFVAMAVGKTKEGESFPAKPSHNQHVRKVRAARIGATAAAPYLASRSPCRCRGRC